MNLRGIEFRNVMNAAGAQGFFGEGYPYHRLWRWLGLTFDGCGFVSKTTTFLERAGNMPLKKDHLTPQEIKPRCIRVYPFGGYTMNAVGLSGPGVEYLLKQNRWQALEKPFLASFMAIGEHADMRLLETRGFASYMKATQFRTGWGVEVNFSCPNVGLHMASLLSEVSATLDVFGELDVPIVVKLNALVSPYAAKAIAEHEQCDALTMSNSIPWGALPQKIPWHSLFGSDISPLNHLGGGGLSGNPLLPVVVDWIKQARKVGITKPIIACGGIMNKNAVRQVIEAGADGLQLGVVAMLRPWRMKGMIRTAYRAFARRVDFSFQKK